MCNAGIERERAIRINILYFETLVETSLQRLEKKVRFINHYDDINYYARRCISKESGYKSSKHTPFWEIKLD